MKIERSNVSAANIGGARRGPAVSTGRVDGANVSIAHSYTDTSEILGIPEAELTPKVRAAILSLMAEVARMRDELNRNRGRIDHLEKLADQDTLLPIYNRRAFVRELTRAISMTERYGKPSSIAYFDVNGMKGINDRFGHGAGDAALLKVADSLLANIRDSDFIGRLGGDEFGVILYNSDGETAQVKAAALAAAVSATPIIFDSQSVVLGVTYGTYTFTGQEDPGQAIAAADEAMYARKRAGS